MMALRSTPADEICVHTNGVDTSHQGWLTTPDKCSSPTPAAGGALCRLYARLTTTALRRKKYTIYNHSTEKNKYAINNHSTGKKKYTINNHSTEKEKVHN